MYVIRSGLAGNCSNQIFFEINGPTSNLILQIYENSELVQEVKVKANILKYEKKDYILPKKKNTISINWVAPQPIIGSGGHRNIYRIVHYLAKKGYNVTMYIDPQDPNNHDYVKSGYEAYEKIKNNFFDLECSIVYGTDNI